MSAGLHVDGVYRGAGGGEDHVLTEADPCAAEEILGIDFLVGVVDEADRVDEVEEFVLGVGCHCRSQIRNVEVIRRERKNDQKAKIRNKSVLERINRTKIYDKTFPFNIFS
jgi:hypothetical protein